MTETRTLLLEVLTEEIPSRFMPGTLRQLESKGAELFQKDRLVFQGINVYGTPRRLAVVVEGLAERQESAVEKKKGPPYQAAFDHDGKPTKAALGFARSQGLVVEDLVVEKIGDASYLFAVKEIPGQNTLDVLPFLLRRLLSSLSFPKSMYWTGDKTRFARPVRNIACLFGSSIVPFSFAGVSSGSKSYGHRFLAPGSWTIPAGDKYLEVMEKGKVVADHRQRELLILQGIKEAAASLGGRAVINEDLLQEVNFLVENPAIVLGSFPDKYLELPREVPITVMQVHQKYFAVEDEEGALLPNFIAVANGKKRNMEKVRAGNEKVLRARLADARFFYEEDRRQKMVDLVDKLKTIVYHEGLGTMLEKTMRIKKSARHIMDITGQKEKEELVLRAAYLAKGDLVSYMVREFPELQGVTGKNYALEDGEDAVVAEAIFEHYLPKFAGDNLPATAAGTLLALADKMDHLVSCFAVGIRPSGSQDPYALRRTGVGIVQILLEKKISLPLPGLLDYLLGILREQGVAVDNEEKLKEDLLSFLEQRLRHLLQEKHFKHDVIEAAVGSLSNDFLDIYERCELLAAHHDSEELDAAAAAYQRVANLAAKGGEAVALQESLFQEEAELELWRQARQVEDILSQPSQTNNLAKQLSLLAGLKPAVDNFFDEVMVMAEDESIRKNRLALLRYVQLQFLSLAELSKLLLC